jgi:hypothetical protein
MKAYVINLPERTDRWETFTSNWKDSGLELVRVDAFKMENVYHAVFLKHRELLQQAKDRGETHLLVMEDDAIPYADFTKRFQHITEYLDNRNDWDVMNGGMLAIRDCITQVVKIKHPELSTLLLNANRGCMAHFLYFKIENALKKIQDWETDGKPEFDAWYSHKLNCYASIPYLAIQMDGVSDATKDERKWEERFRFEQLDLMYRLREFL